MAHLSTHLLDPRERPAVVADACALVDRELARTSGLSGMALRAAHRVVVGIRPGMVPHAVDALLPAFADQLDPFYQEYVATGTPLPVLLDEQRGSMADALLSITDDRVSASSNGAVRRAYQSVRRSARGHVEAAAPGIGALLSAHVPEVSAEPGPD